MTRMSPRDTADRRERATKLCARLTADVCMLVPEGIGRWERTWEIVGRADAHFMVALTGWEADPSDATKDHVRLAYHAVLDAWKRAVEEFRARGSGAMSDHGPSAETPSA